MNFEGKNILLYHMGYIAMAVRGTDGSAESVVYRKALRQSLVVPTGGDLKTCKECSYDA